jgi:ATP-binding protein involved in chromosome partitioning
MPHFEPGASEIDAAQLVEDVELVRARVAEQLAGVERVAIAMSGKGGVGKSSVAVNLACALARRGRRVGLLDADLNAPTVSKMLGLRGQPVRVSADGQIAAARGPHGMLVQSMDFFLQGNQALDWDGPEGEGAQLRSAFEQAALGDLLGRTSWGALDWLVIDLAPGADRLPALGRLLPPIAAALAVAVPTEVALLAVDRSLRRAREAGIPLIGWVENLASAVCPRCGAETPLFGDAHDDGARDFARRLGLERLARIPFDAQLAAAADRGEPFLERAGGESAAGRAFEQLASRVDAYRIPGSGGESW